MIPVLHSSGKYKVNPPYTLPTVVYSCVGLRDLASLILEGIDAFTKYYLPVGLTEADFADATTRNDIIVTLANATDIVSIPSYYFSNDSIEPTIDYSTILLAVNLGDLPDSLSLNSLLANVIEVTTATIGIVPIVDIVRKDSSNMITESDSKVLEFNRKNVISSDISFYKGKVDADAKLQDALDIISRLQTYILSLPK